jgi:hypothetical protein
VHDATFVLSTGRCGTQWLARALAAVAGHHGARVEHEPLGDHYRSRRLLGDGGDPAALSPADRARLETHVGEITATLERGAYVETGFPCWAALPYLARRLVGRMRVVHLTRHPIPVAYSWTTHSAYARPLWPGQPEKTLLHPADGGVAFPHYAAIWPELHAFERCLYFWAEVNAFALRWEKGAGVPWLRVDAAELFRPEGIARVAAFALGATGRAEVRADGDVADEHHFQLTEWIEPDVIRRHPAVIEVARQLGYDPFAVDRAALRRRYFPAGSG